MGLLFLANALTLSRLLLAALIWVFPADAVIIFVTILIAGISDVLDGWCARLGRARMQASGLAPSAIPSNGVWLDPVCDKIFVLSVLARAWEISHPAWSTLFLIATREFIQVSFFSSYLLAWGIPERSSVDFHASILGKLTTAAQFICIVCLLLQPDWVIPLALGTAMLGAVAGMAYVRRIFRQVLLARRAPLC